MTPYRVAICGLSPIAARRPETTLFGRLITSHAAGYATHPACTVVGVCDLRPDLIRAFREAWGDTWPTAAGYAVAGHLLDEARPDLFSVCTPDHRHTELVELAAVAGVKGILCEAPLATSVADVDRILAAVERAGARLVVHHPRRYDPLFHLVRDAIRFGDIGEPRHLRCYHAGPRPLLFRHGVHAIDALCFLAEARVTEVMGTLEPGFEHWDVYRGDGGHETLGEPVANARLVFENGVLASYDGARSRQRALWFDVIGSDGMIRVSGRHAELSAGGTARILVPPPYDTVGIAAAVGELVRLVGLGGESVGPPESARHDLEVLEAILRSNQVGGAAVRLPPREGPHAHHRA